METIVQAVSTTVEQPCTNRQTEVGRATPLDCFESEALIFNLQSASQIHKRPQFFSWTQGLLQSLIKHELLLCIIAQGDNSLSRQDHFSAQPVSDELSRELGTVDLQYFHKLAEQWRANDYQALTLTQNDPLLAGTALSREMARIEASQLLLHGMPGTDGKQASLYAFICRPENIRPRQSYLLELIAPSIHAAWMRTRIEASPSTGTPGSAFENTQLTRREQEVLRWIYQGKSNIEIGLILGISPLTVKNHVQEILRRLNVLNRAQAVGKALSLNLISPR